MIKIMRLHMSYYCNTVRYTWWDWSLSSFSASTLLVGFFTRKHPSLIWPVMRSMERPYSTFRNAPFWQRQTFAVRDHWVWRIMITGIVVS